ncbi:MAG: hypothetical protein AAF414_04750 [Pseudomonadota bacterium]
MEQTVTEGLSVGMLLCRLMLGTADCSAAISQTMPAAEPCVGPVPRYELVIGGPEIDEEVARMVRQRLARPDVCEVSLDIEGGELVLQIGTMDDPMVQVAPILRPGAISLHAVDWEFAPGQALPDGLVQMSRFDGSQDFVVVEEPLLGDAGIESASAEENFGEWAVSIRFDPKSAESFGDITSENLGLELAIAIDDVILAAPRINEPILGGSAMITGGFGEDEARYLATILANGPLPAGLSILSIEVAPDGNR